MNAMSAGVRPRATPRFLHSGLLEFVAIALYRIFVPFYADTGKIRNLKVAVMDSKRLLQNGIGPILPLQPMSRFGHAHQMRCRFWIQMR